MQKFKYEQIKRRNLREFLRKAKDDIVKERGGPGQGAQDRKTQARIHEMAHQAKTAEEKEQVRRMKEGHKAKQL